MLKAFRCDVPEGSHVSADQAYHDDATEGVLREASHIQLYPIPTTLLDLIGWFTPSSMCEERLVVSLLYPGNPPQHFCNRVGS